MTPAAFKYRVGRGPYLDSLKAAAYILLSLPMFTLGLPAYIYRRYLAIHAEKNIQPQPRKQFGWLVLITVGYWCLTAIFMPILGVLGFLKKTD